MLGKNVRWDGDGTHLLSIEPCLLVAIFEQERASQLKLAARGLNRNARLVVFLLVDVIEAAHLLLVRALLAAPLLVCALQHGRGCLSWCNRGGNKLAGECGSAHILTYAGAKNSIMFVATATPLHRQTFP